ncbi:MAG: AAA family ATPase [Defluviitaleaceae bacterium]|nr:AAA family ATPase [Defluviitaleaceae bacterium]MCL2835139.1 AAA family ATPase [Defluviitaleaceae bacterium]
MKLDSISNQIYIVAFNEAKMQLHEFLTPEHFLYAALMFDAGKSMLEASGGVINGISASIEDYFRRYMTKLSTAPDTDNEYAKSTVLPDVPIESFAFMKMFEIAAGSASGAGKEEVALGDILAAIYHLPECFAVYILNKNGVTKLKLLRHISHGAKKDAKATAQTAAQKAVSAAETLSAYTVDLTKMAREGQLDPLIGRGELLERTIQALCRRVKNNPVHVGDAGVGKTAVTHGLAQLIASGDVPDKLKGATIVSLEMGGVLAGTKYRGDFEERLISILDACASLVNPIVFIDEIHSVVGAGAVSGGAMDASGILKPYLQKGTLKFIGATTFDEYRKYFEKDAALSRRFQSIDVPEPDVAETVKMLMGVKSKYEEFHGVTFDESVINRACELAGRYLSDRRLPDKAIDVLDETGAYLRIKNPGNEPIEAAVPDVERTVALMAKIPESGVTEQEEKSLLQLDARLKETIFGQDSAIEAVTSAVRVSRAGLGGTDKPVASLLFVGPTGVGKTEIAKQLANCLNIGLLRYDMSEYQESHSVSRLIGSPPGYVGYENGGLMTDAVRKTPHAVLLLDEIEKAHRDIMNMLLQVMDYGTMTDNTGKKADFRNIIIIMTSNAGASELGKRFIGFDERSSGGIELDAEVKRVFSPEFRNRLDEVIMFNHISPEMAASITRKALNEIRRRLQAKGLSLDVTKAAEDWIASKGMSREYGAREIMRIVNKDIARKLATAALRAAEGGKIKVAVRDGELLIDK